MGISAAGLPLKRFFNTSGLLYKSMGLKDKLPGMSEEEMLQLLATDGMLVKRPLLVGGDFVLVGFKEASGRSGWGDNAKEGRNVMDVQRAKELLAVLADGIDPLTGEVLPYDHVCNKGEIVRALNCAVEELSRRKKRPLPENTGKPWTTEMDDELCRLFDEGVKKKDLCTHFGRTSGSIESRLERLGKL